MQYFRLRKLDMVPRFGNTYKLLLVKHRKLSWSRLKVQPHISKDNPKGWRATHTIMDLAELSFVLGFHFLQSVGNFKTYLSKIGIYSFLDTGNLLHTLEQPCS